MEAGMLTCPECGAPASPEAVRCDHCRVQLQTTRCRCMAMNFVGARHCSRCGEALEEAAAVCTGHLCPRCRCMMQLVPVGETEVEECSRCGGLWVNAASFQTICDSREARAASLGIGSPLVPPPPSGGHAVPETVRYIPCPLCGKLMQRVNFGRSSGVIVDVCKGDGTWFDRDELRRILEFIDKGGLEAAREKEKLQLEEERRRVKTQAIAVAEQPEPAPRHGVVVAAVRGLLHLLVS